LAEGLREPHGVALHPNGEIYVSERGGAQISVIRNGRAEPALAPGWRVSTNLPRWAISERMPLERWMAATLEQPGPVTIATNGTLYVSEQIPDGRILEFIPDENGRYTEGQCIPVPWLDQEFQWRDIFVDQMGRLFITGADEVGSDFMKFGSALMRETDGNWWVIDFGPFADFFTFAMSQRQDVMILGDRRQGNLTWWEVDRHIMLGASPNATGRSKLLALALYPEGSFVIAKQDEPGRASMVRMDPFSGQQGVLVDNLRSVGAIAMNRSAGSYLVTDPAAGRLLECMPSPPQQFNEVAMRQIVRSIEGMMGIASEAPAFLNNFFERLQDAAKDLIPDDSTHAVQFNLSDIAGKMPVIAGRIKAAVEVEGVEEDPIDTVEFFLLFPSKIVLTETAVSPSLSFFSAKRKSGKIEQTRPVFQGDVGVYRLSGTNVSKVATGKGGMHIPVVACGMSSTEQGVQINLSFLGSGIYGDYYLTLFQGAREQTAKLVVKSAATQSGRVVYEASFMDEALIEGMEGKVTREQISNLLVSGFGGGSGASRSVGWLRIGRFPAQMTVAFGDSGASPQLAGAPDGLKELAERKRMEMNLEAAADVTELSDDDLQRLNHSFLDGEEGGTLPEVVDQAPVVEMEAEPLVEPAPVLETEPLS
jgi:hypothetical protein